VYRAIEVIIMAERMRQSRTRQFTAVFALVAVLVAGLIDHQVDEPFRGVTTDGNVITGLFPIRVTGVTTEPVRHAADVFLASLTPRQREATTFPVDDDEWRLWNNVHRYTRQGVGFDEMADTQRDAAFALLAASLSAEGLEESRNIMRLNHHLGELVSNFEEYGEGLYWLTVMGQPSATEPWGWQLDGHHLVVNYFVLRDQVVMTPTFMGSEPVFARSGRYAGTRVLEDEQTKGLAFMRSLTTEQQRVAVIDSAKSRRNALAQAFRDNLVLDYVGIRADALTDAQRVQLLDVIHEYVGNMDDGHARIKMSEVEDHLDETYFAWIGGWGPESVFYYRVQSPVILIEFDHQSPVALDGSEATREHIHSVMRTPNGNDYGKDILRQHYEAHVQDSLHGHKH
jgi:predicted nuclease of restriction endonuclease-like (RecB) superfamily